MRTRPLLTATFLVALGSCATAFSVDTGCDGALFGTPVPGTGLDGTQCRPSCPCSGFASREFTEDELGALERWTLTQEIPALTEDPYRRPAPAREQGVCAVIVEDASARRYHLQTFPDPGAVLDAGVQAILTHHDPCGTCSTLKDLAVYARDRDVGAAVKRCGLDHLAAPVETVQRCIEGLGFTWPCAQTWGFNLRNTQAHCWGPCILAGPYHRPDGTLSDCLACDERESGPVFKAVAGRTRRNTGLATSICRPCAETRPVAHVYP